MRIAANDPVRAAVAGCSDYYGDRVSAVRAVVAALEGFGYEITSRDYEGNPDGDGRTKLSFGKVNPECGMIEDCDCWAVCSYYIMPSGKCELTAYIS